MSNTRRAIAKFFHEENEVYGFAWWIDFALIVLIALNVAAVILETVDPIYHAYKIWFDLFDLFSVLVFTIEYVARVWTIVEDERFSDGWRGRIRYMMTPMAIIDLLAILPFYFSLFIDADLRILRALRLLRVFKLTRYSSAMTMLLDVLQEEAKTLFACFFILFILLIITSTGAYLVEQAVQPDVFGSIPDSMWWALVTLTTVGYGDVTPVTPLGRIFGGIVTIIGVGMAALPAGILASGLADQLHVRRDDLRRQFREALEDGVICDQEEYELEELRKKLGISRKSADTIRQEIMVQQADKTINQCPHCGKEI